MADLGATIEGLARPVAADAGLDLVAVEIKAAGARTKVLVKVDRKGGVDIASCQAVAKALSRALDQADPVSQRYTLEVTSPGTDQPLTDQRGFDRVEGRNVKAVMRDPDGEEGATREVRGTVTAAGPDAAVLTDTDGTAHAVPYHEIVRATQEMPW